MTDPCRRACAAAIPNPGAKSQGKQPRHPISPGARTEELTRQASSRLQNNLAADPLLSHEHIQSVTILPDHGVLDRRLLPGLVLGIATMLVPKYLPRLGGAVSPLVKSTVRGAYKMGQKTREMVAEVQEQVHDIVAEVDAEGDKKAATPKSSARSPMPAA